MIRVIVADDHPLVRDGIVTILSRAGDIEVVGDAADGVELLSRIAEHGPDIILTDLRMPGGDGVDAIRAIRAGRAGASNSSVRILVLTTYDTDRDVRASLAAGADGYLLKDCPREELIRAVRDLAAGRPVLSRDALRALAVPEPLDVRLTARETEVLRELARGGTNREAADRLFVSEATFKTHLAHVYDKFGVADRAAAVRVAYERGLL